jgi:hypothetical protein
MIKNSLPVTWGPVLLGVGNHLWQSTLFAAVIASLTLILRKNRARTRYSGLRYRSNSSFLSRCWCSLEAI